VTGTASYRLRIGLFLISSVVTLVAANAAYQALNTLNRLDLIERERDQWQRSQDIIGGLDLREGSVVADLGCGAGYFTLKLSSAVGVRGRVLAVDIRRLSLAFLWMRTVLKGERNVSIIQGEPGDPLLPGKVDAVLLVNTYHELTEGSAVLEHVFSSLQPGGRLVIADRSPENPGQSHEIAMDLVEEQLLAEHFEILSRQEHFLEQPGEGSWWLILARRPNA
jgi:SAM-dependent methyltransferase